MLFLLISFAAGVLTVLAPCILPLLPVIIGGSAAGGSNKRAFTIIGSLVISIVLFTILIKVSSIFLNVSPDVWKYVSSVLLLGLASTMIFPGLWEKIPYIGKLSVSSNKVLGAGFQKKSVWGDVTTGAALGPVFSTCSPTYFVILATVLPASFPLGLVYLSAYAIGLGAVLLLIAFFGQRVANALNIAANPEGPFKKIIGVLFVLVALGIATGYDKKLQTAILDAGFFDVTQVEQSLLKRVQPVVESKQVEEGGIISETSGSSDAVDDLKKSMPTIQNVTNTEKGITEKKSITKSLASLGRYKEFVSPSGYLNTGGQAIQMSDYIGKKIVVLSIMTYSCINCQRTVPYLNDWYKKYEDDGLVIIAIHTPEFTYEKKIENVQKELVEKQGVRFPVVLDNDYATWNSYQNQYWPRKYVIDLQGNIVYDHIGEGAYAETETIIQQLLKTVLQN